ncbi:MAG: virulence RhuM family protein [Proteobacteria bacterium]|nr:virulence RhuM family protein [Pseudomonadota bacterium]
MDAIILVDYRVSSNRAFQFCIWAAQWFRKYLAQGYSLNCFISYSSVWVTTFQGFCGHL